MKLRGKARQRERARRRAAEQWHGGPLVMSQDRRQAMLRDRGGDLAAIVGREDECIEVLTQALELDPDDFHAHPAFNSGCGVAPSRKAFARAWL